MGGNPTGNGLTHKESWTAEENLIVARFRFMSLLISGQICSSSTLLFGYVVSDYRVCGSVS